METSDLFYTGGDLNTSVSGVFCMKPVFSSLLVTLASSQNPTTCRLICDSLIGCRCEVLWVKLACSAKCSEWSVREEKCDTNASLCPFSVNQTFREQSKNSSRTGSSAALTGEFTTL